MSDEPYNDPDHLDIHEAGHAVIARVLTSACGGASLEAELLT